MSDEPTFVDGPTPHDRFVVLAGMLAEHGVQTLIVSNNAGEETTLNARTTDLPGVLAQFGDCEVRAMSGDVGAEATIMATVRDGTIELHGLH